MSNAAFEVTWLLRVLEELHISIQKLIGKNLLFHERNKNIEINYHFTKDKPLEGLIQLSYL